MEQNKPSKVNITYARGREFPQVSNLAQLQFDGELGGSKMSEAQANGGGDAARVGSPDVLNLFDR